MKTTSILILGDVIALALITLIGLVNPYELPCFRLTEYW
jgi:hypothetical protein